MNEAPVDEESVGVPTAGRRTRAADAGVSSVEVVLMTPLIVTMLLFIVALGVMVNVRSEVEGAARDAARAGSLQGNGDDATAQALAAADADLGSRCQDPATVTSTYVPPVAGGGGYWKVTVACTVNMSGFGMFGAHQTFSQTFAAPIDPLQNFHPGPVPTSTAPPPSEPSTPEPTQFSIPSWLTPSVLPTNASTTTVGGPSTSPTTPTTPPTPTTPTGTDSLPTPPATTPPSKPSPSDKTTSSTGKPTKPSKPATTTPTGH